jgi:hypothetical protein
MVEPLCPVKISSGFVFRYPHHIQSLSIFVCSQQFGDFLEFILAHDLNRKLIQLAF